MIIVILICVIIVMKICDNINESNIINNNSNNININV